MTAVQIESLSKRYRLGQIGTGTLVHDLNRWWHRMRGRGDPYLRVTETNDRSRSSEQAKGETGYVWALRNVSLEIREGDVLGIIGRNGAGKSTLLKILSQITAPTTGVVRIRGRIASLLEVGTGFHQELTGRENIFLNGAILGMSKAEVRSKIDEIVEFSGCARYIDTPVKRYSSGMIVRLGFAVAAYLEPEILVVDEVLAVGDAEFQKKCLGKMEDVASGGRTVLFVSHNMAMIQNLCSTVAVLQNGELEFIGSTDAAISRYLQTCSPSLADTERLHQCRDGNFSPVLESVEVLDTFKQPTDAVPSGGELTFRIGYRAHSRLRNPVFGIIIETAFGQPLIALQTRYQREWFSELPERGTVNCTVPAIPLIPGRYFLSLGCSANGKTIDRLFHVVSFDVEETDYFGTGHLPKAEQGAVLLAAEWNFITRTGQGCPIA